MSDTDTKATQGFETLALHGGPGAGSDHQRPRRAHLPDDVVHVRQLRPRRRPVRPSKEFGNIYTRIMNPTTDVFEKRVAALEGGVGGLAFSSGSAAVTFSILNIAGAGDHIVTADSLYGGTYNLFVHTLPRFGLDVELVDPNDPENFRRAIRPKTKLLYAETVGNPKLDTLDIEAVAAIAHEAGIPLIVDNTIGDAVPAPADRPRRGHRGPLGDQVHRRPRYLHRRRDRGLGQVRLGQNGKFPGLSSRTRATTA